MKLLKVFMILLLSAGMGCFLGVELQPFTGIDPGYFAAAAPVISTVVSFGMNIEGFAMDGFPAFTKGLCIAIQKSLIEIYKTGAPQLQRTPVGYLQALRSAANMAGVEMLPVDEGTGKKKTVRIKYLQRGVASDIITTPPTDCVATVQKEYLEENIDVTNYIGTKGLHFSEAEMRKLCEADSAFIEAVISTELDPLMVELDKQLLAIQLANLGKFNPDISPSVFKNVAMTTTNDAPLYIGEKRVGESFRNLGFNGRPLVIGAGILDDYVMQAKIGCCNLYGIDMARAGAFDYYYDLNAGAILGGTDRFVGIAPGKVQLLTWNKYKGEYRKMNDVFAHTTIIDPFTGIPLDLKIKYDDCAESWYIQFGVYYEPFFVPSDAFAYGDPLAGVNYTLGFNAQKV